MRRKLIAAASVLGVGGAFFLALVLGAPASSADTKVDAFACTVVWRDGHWVTHCGEQQ